MKTISLGVVIGANIGSALRNIELVTNSTKFLGNTIEKLNSKKIKIFDTIDKEFNAKLAPIENKLKQFYEKQKKIKFEIKIKQGELKEFQKKLKTTEKEIKTLEKEKLSLERKFKKGTISAEEFKNKTQEIENELSKLHNKKLGLNEKISSIEKKTTILKNSLQSVNRTLNNLKNKRLKLKDELEKAKEKAKETNKEIIKLGEAVEELNKRKVKIEANIEKREQLKNKALDTVALGASIAVPFKAGIEFESSMARVKALSGATEEQFKQLEETAKRLGATTTFSASQAAEGMQKLAMAGFSSNQIIKAMPGLLSLAAVGQTDLGETADITSNILSGFGIKANKTGHVADVLAKAMTTANVDIRMLGETMKYVGPAAASLGASLEETTALAAQLGNVGIQGSEAGTALRSMYLRMASPPSEARKEIEKLGLKLKDSKGNFVGMVNIIQQLQEKTKGLSNARVTEIMKHLFGTEAVSASIALTKIPIEQLKKYEKSLINADGTAKKIAEIQNNTIAGSFKALGSAVEGLSISFSSLFLPTIQKVTQGITWLTSKINSFVEHHKILATILGGVVGGFGILTVATFTLGYAMTFISNGVQKTLALFKLLRIATLLVATTEGRATLSTKLLSFWNGVLATKTKLATISQIAMSGATSILSTTMGVLGSAVRFVGSGVVWLGRALMANPIGLAIAVIAGGAYLIYSNWDRLKSFFSGLWLSVKNIFINSWQTIKKILSFTPIGMMISRWTFLKNFFASFWAGIKGGFVKGTTFITSVFLHPINIIQKYWHKLVTWISEKIKWITSVGKKVKNFFSFGDDEKNDKKEDKKLDNIKPVMDKIKPIVGAVAVSGAIATAQPIETQSITSIQNSQNNQTIQTAMAPQNIVYNFQFGDIKVEARDGKIVNPTYLKNEIERILKEIQFEHKQRSLSDVM